MKSLFAPLSMLSAVALAETKPAAATATDTMPSLSQGGELFTTALGLAVVIAVVLGIGWILRRGRVVGGNVADVSLVGQLPLGVKEKLLVVQVGEEKLLLGCTSDSIRRPHSWSSPATEAPDSALQGTPFANVLGKLYSPSKGSSANSSTPKSKGSSPSEGAR